MGDGWLSARACAKLNLFLEVREKRGDGYHEIDSVFVEIDLADTVQVRLAGDGSISLECDDPALPAGEENLAVRAALTVQQWQVDDGRRPKGLEMRLHKRIPDGGGLGGGSSDAATALRLANSLWECGLSEGALCSLAATLGSDVPFFIHGGTCRCQGRGDIVHPVFPFPERLELGLALPPFPSSTVNAYRNIHLPRPGEARSPEAFIGAMERGDAAAMRELAFNRFEESVFRDLPELGAAHSGLEDLLGHSVRMSGSGSALWFFAEKGWRENRRLSAWAEAKGVRLLSARAAKRMQYTDAP